MAGYLVEDERKVTTHRLIEMKKQGRKIAMLTSYDYTMAQIVDQAGMDIILVGDSASNVMAGNLTTLPITMDQVREVFDGVNASSANGYDEESQTVCGVRAVARLQLTREMLKNKGVMAEVLSWMKVLREATPQQAAKLPLDKDEQDMFKLLVLLGPDFRKGITPYGYWGKETERQYLFVCSDNPRLMMMVYVHVGKGLDFEWFDLNESNKYLKLAAQARRNGTKGDNKEQDK